MTRTTAFPTSNYGMFAGHLPCDREGYAYLTISGWLSADVDWGDMDRAERRAWAREAKAETLAAMAEADTDIAAWRRAN